MREDHQHDVLELYHTRGVFTPTRTIYLLTPDDEVTGQTLENFAKNFEYLAFLNAEPIKLVLSTVGGSEPASNGIYDIIKASHIFVTGTVVGDCSSAGIAVLQACDHRQAYKTSTLLLHDGSVDLSGDYRSIEKNVEFNKLMRLKYYRMLEEATGQPAAYWSRKLATDYILDAEGALKEGLIDEIL